MRALWAEWLRRWLIALCCWVVLAYGLSLLGLQLVEWM